MKETLDHDKNNVYDHKKKEFSYVVKLLANSAAILIFGAVR